MNIDYAKEFIEIAECLSFTEAANNLNITQPALSKHILALEREFGDTLLNRSRKGLQLTEAGRIFFESANIIVESYNHAKELIEQLKANVPIRVSGHMADSDASTLISMTTMLARENYNTTVVFDRSESDPLELVIDGTTDLFIGYVDEERAAAAGLVNQPFVISELLAIVGLTNPLASKKTIRWEDLRGCTLIKFMSEATDPAWNQITKKCQKHGFAPKVRPVSARNNVEFFSTPMRNDVLIWKRTEKQIGLLLETGRRIGIPMEDEDAKLIVYATYRPETEERLAGFFAATAEAKALLDARHAQRKSHR